MRKIGIEFPCKGMIALVDIGDPPRPGPREVLIETAYSGLTNGTERQALLGMHGWKGLFPSRHGYQHVGSIVSKGDQVEGFEEGDTVFYGRYVGHRGWNLQNVACADRRSYDSHLTIKLPRGPDPEASALLGVAGVGMRAVRRLRIQGPQNVWVAGAGPIGLFAAQSAKAYGARVTATDLIASRLRVAKRLGVDIVIDASEKGWEKTIKAEGPYDRIIDACGAPSLMEDIQRLGILAHGGAIGLIAVRSRTNFAWSMLHGTEASIEVSCHFSLDDLDVLLRYLRRELIRIRPIITHRIPIEEAASVYRLLREKPSELLGVIFDWA